MTINGPVIWSTYLFVDTRIINVNHSVWQYYDDVMLETNIKLINI